MATIADFKVSATLYKRRKGAGRIPLHSNVSFSLPEHKVTEVDDPNYLKLSSVTIGCRWVGKQQVVVIVGHYGEGRSVEKRFSADMPMTDDLPKRIHR